ncbi:MAG TPA: hypothetical protein VFN23_03170, partial [Ktedonobacteraceae bacterium]|nr:hypothetical protein [Ktedonobacteraceae bacterium]
RFRLFLSYWALGNLFIYSWAAEKMPWLMIHIMLPMLLLGGIMLAPLLKWTWALILDLRARSRSAQTTEEAVAGAQPRWSSRERWRTGTAVFGVIAVLLLLLPTVHNMYEVSYVHAADGPHEMMIYVQTTTDLNIVMGKLDALDQKLYGGKHQLYIGVMSGANWPFLWYLRDYKHLCLSYPSGCSQDAQSVQAIVAADTDLPNAITQFANSDGGKGQFAYHQYHLRSWWSQGYMPPPCLVSPTNNCVGQSTWPGVGPWLWLSYGDAPPVGAKFNLGLAVQHVWQWWWERRPIGSTDGATDMGLFINSKLGVAP